MTLHKIVLYCLIKVWPKLFDRYLDEYCEIYLNNRKNKYDF